MVQSQTRHLLYLPIIHPQYAKVKFEKLLLTHQDIAPRNLILNALGKVWLIDWAFAGAYPEGFERVALFIQCRFHFPEFMEKVGKLVKGYPELGMQRVSIAYGLTTAALAWGVVVAPRGWFLGGLRPD